MIIKLLSLTGRIHGLGFHICKGVSLEFISFPLGLSVGDVPRFVVVSDISAVISMLVSDIPLLLVLWPIPTVMSPRLLMGDVPLPCAISAITVVISWASYQIRNIAGCTCTGNAGNVSPRRRFQRKPLVSDPGMHHSTCVTHVPWCMSGSLACSDGENVPGIPGACAPAILRIWQEAHCGCW